MFSEESKVLENMNLFVDPAEQHQDNSDLMYFSYDEFFEYFETLNIVVILNEYLEGT